MTAKHYSPWKNEHHFHIKQQKDQRDNIKTGVERQPGITGNFFAAFVRGKLLGIGVMRRQHPVDKESKAHHDYSCNKEDKYLAKF